MYRTKPPSTSSFDPSISGVARMPTPPPSLRPLIHRLNKTPTRSSKATSSSTSQSSGNLPTRNRITEQSQPNLHTPGPQSLHLDTHEPNASALSQALMTLLNTPPTSRTLASLDLANCRISVHVHIHPTVRPAFPSPRSHLDRLKRKRSNSEDEEQAENGPQSPVRQAKKVKLSHDADSGFTVRGRAGAGRMPVKAEVGARGRARSRICTRRMSSRRTGGMAGRL